MSVLIPRRSCGWLIVPPRFTAAMILELGYGRTVTGVDDEFIRLVDEGVSQALSGTGTTSGNALVDYFPIRK